MKPDAAFVSPEQGQRHFLPLTQLLAGHESVSTLGLQAVTHMHKQEVEAQIQGRFVTSLAWRPIGNTPRSFLVLSYIPQKVGQWTEDWVLTARTGLYIILKKGQICHGGRKSALGVCSSFTLATSSLKSFSSLRHFLYLCICRPYLGQLYRTITGENQIFLYWPSSLHFPGRKSFLLSYIKQQ